MNKDELCHFLNILCRDIKFSNDKCHVFRYVSTVNFLHNYDIITKKEYENLHKYLNDIQENVKSSVNFEYVIDKIMEKYSIQDANMWGRGLNRVKF